FAMAPTWTPTIAAAATAVGAGSGRICTRPDAPNDSRMASIATQFGCTCGSVATSVDAALRLRRTRPPSGAGILTRLDAPRARGASDRAVPVEQQRVHQDPVLGDVLVHVVLRPGSNRVELHHRPAGVPLDDPR